MANFNQYHHPTTPTVRTKFLSSSATNLVNNNNNNIENPFQQSTTIIKRPQNSNQIINQSQLLLKSTAHIINSNNNNNIYSYSKNPIPSSSSTASYSSSSSSLAASMPTNGTTTIKGGESSTLRQRILQLEKENRQLMSNQGSLIIETNKRIQTQVNEYRLLREENGKLSGENAELRDLCCYLDDDRQKTKRLCKEWQRFGRYTAGVMKSEVDAYRAKLSELELRQEHLVAENAEMKQLCLFLDEQRNKAYTCSNCGATMSLSDQHNEDNDGGDVGMMKKFRTAVNSNMATTNNLDNKTFTKTAINKLLTTTTTTACNSSQTNNSSSSASPEAVSNHSLMKNSPLSSAPKQSILKNASIEGFGCNCEPDNAGKSQQPENPAETFIISNNNNNQKSSMDKEAENEKRMMILKEGRHFRRNFNFDDNVSDLVMVTNSAEDCNSYSPAGNSEASECPTFSSRSSSDSGRRGSGSGTGSGASLDGLGGQGREENQYHPRNGDAEQSSNNNQFVQRNGEQQEKEEMDNNQQTDTKVLEYIEQLERRVEQLEENRINRQEPPSLSAGDFYAGPTPLINSNSSSSSDDSFSTDDKITIRLRGEGGGNPLITSTDSTRSVGTSTIYGSEDGSGVDGSGQKSGPFMSEEDPDEEYPDEFIIGGGDYECERITEDEGFPPSEESASPANSTLTPIEEEMSDDFDDSDLEDNNESDDDNNSGTTTTTTTTSSSDDEGLMTKPAASRQPFGPLSKLKLGSHLSRSVPTNLSVSGEGLFGEGDESRRRRADGGLSRSFNPSTTWGPLYRTSSERLDNAQNIEEEDAWTTSIASQGKTLSEALKVLEIQERQEQQETMKNGAGKAGFIINRMSKVVWKTVENEDMVGKQRSTSSSTSMMNGHLALDNGLTRTFL